MPPLSVSAFNNDEEYATEQAAYGIALLVMQQLTNFTVVERARRGTGQAYG